MSFKNYTTAQVAEILQTNPQTIRASRTTGVLFERESPRFIKFGKRKILYPSEEIEKFLNIEKKRKTY